MRRSCAVAALLGLLAGLAFVADTAHAQAPDACTTPDGSNGCWLIGLDEGFGGPTLNPEIWEPGWFVDSGYSPSVNVNENACYNSDQVSIADGLLTIRLDPTTSPDCLDKQGDVAPFVGGIVTSRDAINDPTHAGRLDDSFYLEARVRTPSIAGEVRNWPAFWSTGFGPWPVTGEFDVLEGLRGEAKFNYHYSCPQVGGRCQAGATAHPAASGDGGWHIYAVQRTLATADTPAMVTYFFDGVEVATIAKNVVDSPHYIIFSYTSHRTHDTTTTDMAMDVDWVRVYRPAGDVTCDRAIGADDVVAMLQYRAGERDTAGACPIADPATHINPGEGDLNGDGELNLADALLLSQCLAEGDC